MRAPFGYFLTWTTYGTWLPGDGRGWVGKHDTGHQPPDPERQSVARGLMKESPVYLEPAARRAAEAGIREVCLRYGWTLHAVQVQRSHAHAVVSAGDVPPGRVLGVLKAAASKRLNLMDPSLHREHWWSKDGSKRYLNDENSLAAAITYTLEQDTSWQKHIP